jgi:hypothetical protein
MTANPTPPDDASEVTRERKWLADRELARAVLKDDLDELKEWLADDYALTDPKEIDRLLRDQAREFDHNWAVLVQYIHHARDCEIHKDLGFKSWPDYIADVARTEMPNIARSVEQRRQVVALLAGEGMSQRAIADAVKVSQKTVDRDLDQVSHNDSPCPPTDFADLPRPDTVTGRDGKQYPAKPKPRPDVPKPAAEPGPQLSHDDSVEPTPSTSPPHTLDPEIVAARQRQLARFLDWVIQGDMVCSALTWDYTDMPAEVAQLREAGEHLAWISEELNGVITEYSGEQQ